MSDVQNEAPVVREPLDPDDVARRVADARKLAFMVRPGQLVGGKNLTEQEADAINAENQERAETYCRWRINGWQEGTISSL